MTDTNGERNGHFNGSDGHDPPHTDKSHPVIAFDVERYQHFLDDQGLSADQKRAMLEALWSIIVGFVDLGFGIHPVQQACGQSGQHESECSGGVRDEVYSNYSAQIIEGEAVVVSAAGEKES